MDDDLGNLSVALKAKQMVDQMADLSAANSVDQKAESMEVLWVVMLVDK